MATGSTAGDGEESVHLHGLMADGHKNARAKDQYPAGYKARRRRVQAQMGRDGTVKKAGGMAVKAVDKTSAAQSFVVPKEQIGELQRILDGQKSSFRETYKT